MNEQEPQKQMYELDPTIKLHLQFGEQATGAFGNACRTLNLYIMNKLIEYDSIGQYAAFDAVKRLSDAADSRAGNRMPKVSIIELDIAMPVAVYHPELLENVIDVVAGSSNGYRDGIHINNLLEVCRDCKVPLEIMPEQARNLIKYGHGNVPLDSMQDTFSIFYQAVQNKHPDDTSILDEIVLENGIGIRDQTTQLANYLGLTDCLPRKDEKTYHLPPL